MKVALLVLAGLIGVAQAQPPAPRQHLFIITTDGVRWREIFQGGDPSLAANLAPGDSARAFVGRRDRLAPFLWTTVAEHGQLLGDRAFGNEVNVKNVFRISYPGYNELLTGFADPVFIPNLPVRNRNRTVLAACNEDPGHCGRTAAFTTWTLFPSILNERRDKIVLNPACSDQDAVEDPDEKTFCRAMRYLGAEKPDLVFISFGETDEWAHRGNYARYLSAIRRVDDMIGRLWAFVQSDPEYRDRTTFVITTDHGRADGKRWHTHGPFSRGSGHAWMALIGPSVAPLGEARTPARHYLAEVASSAAWLLKIDFPVAGRKTMPVPGLFRDEPFDSPPLASGH